MQTHLFIYLGVCTTIFTFYSEAGTSSGIGRKKMGRGEADRIFVYIHKWLIHQTFRGCSFDPLFKQHAHRGSCLTGSRCCQFALAVQYKQQLISIAYHSTKKPVTTMLTYPWKCTVLHCNHLGNTWKPLVLMTRHFDYYPSASEGDNQSVGSSAPVVSRCFPGGYNVKLYISRGRLAWWLLAFLHSLW